ncbi:hypothetical protein [Aquitalea aquatica]|uniref:Uncharacterized protein n=1 Tax=Aquitalea aquatica TaxID=3044273 RepID=A0A838YIZ0_9NEIS|nr:hypothetical protein [Aquitalea magnusonii]MBA4710541.1 hypothetical protein [Aquitalea magnusonii]
MELETVKIAAEVTAENPLGYIVINKTDLTEDHALFDELAKDDSSKKAKGKKTAAATTDTNGDGTTDTTTQGGNEGA